MYLLNDKLEGGIFDTCVGYFAHLILKSWTLGQLMVPIRTFGQLMLPAPDMLSFKPQLPVFNLGERVWGVGWNCEKILFGEMGEIVYT